ncbi:MAG: ABC-F family ATP-binding cassette domain-containing protein [Lachnospiraceae bacterium]|nr:ABC-F family ATP-binding cassette domain-containing protein [Lachnospiraceae bacterium]
MNLLTLQNISMAYTDKVLLKDVSLGMNENDRIGVIGVNGTGKSTFLKIVAGVEKAAAGEITRGRNVRIAYLPQNPMFDNSISILENVTSGIHNTEQFWNVEGEAKSMLLKLGIVDLDLEVNRLSGGQRKRMALVRTLLTPADILVLDEPTNHLDNEMTEWLETYLREQCSTYIMVTHDRYFLDKVTNRIVELDKGNLYTYDTNYEGFLALKAEREDMMRATERKNRQLFKQDLEWMQRGARARSTKQKAHIQRFESLKNREKLDLDVPEVTLNTLSSRLGKKIIEVNNISKGYGDKVLISNFTYTFLRQDRIGIIGHNGCGKTTLLKMITGFEQPDSGDIAIGETVKIGYFSQENEYMPEELRVIDYIKETAEYIDTVEGKASASTMCERFLFDATLQYSRIEKLSGGEKRRLYLLKVLMEAPNVLILDEPTNDLDIHTLTILEDYLSTYDGVVITVSHDRYFLDKVVERIFAFEENGALVQYEGNYTDYREKKGDTEKKTVSKNVEADGEKKQNRNNWKKPSDKLKFTYKEEKEYETIDEDIATLEGKLEALEEKIMEAASDYGKLAGLSKEKEELEAKLEEKMERWVYLNDLAERIEKEKLSKE